jgi:hypothetical protein
MEKIYNKKPNRSIQKAILGPFNLRILLEKITLLVVRIIGQEKHRGIGMTEKQEKIDISAITEYTKFS